MALAKELVANGLFVNAAKAVGGSIVTGITAGTTQTQAGATALTGANNVVGTVGTTNDGVILPVAEAGDTVFVRNSGANTAKVYPAVGGAINGGSANAAVTLAAGASTTFRYISEINVVQ
jgi:hypothetical protein